MMEIQNHDTNTITNINNNDDDEEEESIITNPMQTPTPRRRIRIRIRKRLLFAIVTTLLITLFLMGVGIALLAAPSSVLDALLPCTTTTSNSSFSNSGREEMLGIILGGTIVASSIGFLIQFFFFVWWRKKNDYKKNKKEDGSAMLILTIMSQAIFGLILLLIGLFLNDTKKEEDGGGCEEYSTVSLLTAGAIILFLCSLVMMIFVWPFSSSSDDDDNQPSSEEETIRREETCCWNCNFGDFCNKFKWCCRSSCCKRNDGINHEATEPLLSQDNNESQQQVEETSNPQINQTSSSRITGTKRLISLASPQMPYLYLGCLILLLRLPFSLSIPHFVSTALSELSQSNYDEAKRQILYLFIIGTIDAILDFWCIFLFGYAKENIVKNVRVDLFGKILRQDIGFFDGVGGNTGEITSRLVSDCEAMSQDLTWFFRFSIESTVRIIGVATYMLIRSPRLGACALAIVPIVGYINKKYGDWLSKNAKSVQDALASANAVSQEAIACVRTVIAMATEEYEGEKYGGKIERHYRLNIRQLYMTGAYYMLVSTFLINTCVQAALLLLGTIMIQNNNLTPEVLLAFMLYQGQLQNETLNLFQSYTSLIKSSGAGDKVFALLDRVPPPPATGSVEILSHVDDGDDDNHHGDGANDYHGGDDDANEVHAAVVVAGQNNIELSSLTFSYPSRPLHRVLDKLNLDIRGGSTVALVGPSGCGKSTIIGLLERFYDPDGGAILVDGVDLRNLDIKAHRRSIGIVTQDPVLFSGTICDNIAYGYSGARMEDIVQAAMLANAHDFITSFPDGYETEVGERGVQLSGGQKQRVSIARAIIKNPRLLLLDEATSALDPESESVVQEALDHLLTINNEMTTIIVAHRLGTVRKAECIAVVYQGSIIEKGSHDDLMEITDGHYRKMVERADAKGILPED